MPYALWIILFTLSPLSWALEDFDRQQIEERIKPVGSVDIEEEAGTASTQKAAPAEEKKLAKLPGQETFEQYCAVCHQAGVAGAPKFHDAADWKPRQSKGVDGLVASAIKGLNAMPPKGTCQSCSEQDIKDAVQYMLPPS
ncbi:cytochrome c5 [Legionella birminghamensis]|uniref:Cytochrome c5 n=1 Tax=Legionella birminghamensis TaxID=28083 RepID=A0A378IDT3_9GAMM|nr:c-type cytochrome [Legionella birminghamensis]KTC66746.1 cytochrome c5 [Legionella birminghamensis]STX32895.1 cytochrome c5 [Legionella birminghamensis]